MRGDIAASADAGRLEYGPLLELSAAYQALAHSSEDHGEAVAAFLEKRKPDFKGK